MYAFQQGNREVKKNHQYLYYDNIEYTYDKFEDTKGVIRRYQRCNQKIPKV